MVSDKCMPIIRSARLGDNINEHKLNHNCLDEFKIRRHKNSIKNKSVLIMDLRNNTNLIKKSAMILKRRITILSLQKSCYQISVCQLLGPPC